MTQPVVGRLTFGVPPQCPRCGGRLRPSFGQIVDADGAPRPYIEPGVSVCRDCFARFFDEAQGDHDPHGLNEPKKS
jgi:hypothetical protein